MGESSAIEWTDATVNFWWGCTHVGPGCLHCYAETFSKRMGYDIFGIGKERRPIASAPALIQKLNADHEKFFTEHGRARRVFIQSMSDLFDKEVPLDWFKVAWNRIWDANNLAIQIVTKRISYVEKRLVERDLTMFWPPHAGLIISVVNQEEADRDIPRLLELKKRLGVPWVGLSVEPMLGPIVIDRWLQDIDWVIIGTESGHGARHMDNLWAARLVNQCKARCVAVLVKQISSGKAKPIKDLEVFPLGLRVREFPNV